MVTVKRIFFVVSVLVQGSFSRPQNEGGPTTSFPKKSDYDYDLVGDYDYGNYDYGKQYGNYGKQYGDYGKQSGDYGKQYGDYGKQYGDYGKQYDDYVKQYTDYVKQYGDYGANYKDYDHTWHYEDDYGFLDDDYTTDYAEYFVFGDRNNPLDSIVHVYDETGQQNSEMPWVYIIVPVVQIDVMYVDQEHELIEDVEMQFPIETFFFELGDFGLGHFDLGDFGIGDFRQVTENYGTEDYSGLDYTGDYNDYPIYGHYQGDKPGLFDTADELPDAATLDYPGLDHDPYWIDWIFMIPPDEMGPVAR